MTLTKRKVITSSAIYTLGDFLTLGVSGFLLIPIYVRFMTPNEYGVFGTVNTMMAMLGVVMMMGFHSAVGRFYFIYKKTGEEGIYLGNLWLFQAISSILLAILLVLWGRPLWHLIAPNVPPEPYLWIVIGGALLSFGSGIYSIWLRVLEKPLVFVAVQLFNTSVIVALIVVFVVFKNGGVLGALIAGLGASLAMTLVSVFMLIKSIEWRFDRRYVKESLAFGGWMMFGTLGSFVLNRVQLFVLQHYANLDLVGILNLGLQLSGVITLISVSFGKAWQPFIYSFSTKELVSSSIARTSKYFVAVMMFPTLVLALLPNEIIEILARPSYNATVPVLHLLSIATFLSTLCLLPSTVLLYEKRADLAQLAMFASAIMNLILNLILVPRLQLTGSVYSMLISALILVFLNFFFAQKTLWVNYRWNEFVRILLLAIILMVINSVVSPSFTKPFTTFFRIGLLICYPFGLIVVGVIEKGEVISFISSGWDYLRSRYGIQRSF